MGEVPSPPSPGRSMALDARDALFADVSVKNRPRDVAPSRNRNPRRLSSGAASAASKVRAGLEKPAPGPHYAPRSSEERFMTNGLKALALVAAIGLAAMNADAAMRFGGCRDLGKRRSPPSAPRAGAPPAPAEPSWP